MSFVLAGVTLPELIATLTVYALIIPPWIFALCGMAASFHGMYGHARAPVRAVPYALFLAAIVGLWCGYLLYREGMRPATLVYAVAAVTLTPLVTAAIAAQWTRFPRMAKHRSVESVV